MASSANQQRVSVSTKEVQAEKPPDWFAEYRKYTEKQAKLVIEARKITTQETIAQSLAVIRQNLNPNGRDPLQIFPEEVWLMIFNLVTDANILFKASRASYVFCKILNKWECIFHVVFPFIEKWLHRGDILDCRQVSVKWRNAVDNYFENYLGGLDSPANPEWPYDFYMGDIDDWFRYEIDWDPDENQVFTCVPNKPHESNPFIGRLVSIDMERMGYGDNDEDEEENITKFHTFVENVGVHIWRLDIHNVIDVHFFNLFKSADRCYLTCCKILQNCPNLKTFYFTQQVHKAEHLEWEDTSLRAELPHLPFLEELSISILGTNEDYARFENKLVEKFLEKFSSQLKRLSLGRWSTTNFQFCSFEKLEQFEIYSNWYEKHNDLRNLFHFNAENLRHLSVLNQKPSEYDDDSFNNPYFQILIRVCNHFPKLCRLTLEIEEKVDKTRNQDIASMPCELVCSTSVTTLTLHLKELQTPLSFLVCFPVLRQLSVEIGFSEQPDVIWRQNISDCYDDTLGAISVDKYLFLNQYPKSMYLSNIWDILPMLKTLKVKGYVYTREGYITEKIPWETKATHQVFMVQQEAIRLKSTRNRKIELRDQLKELSSQITKANTKGFSINSKNDPMCSKGFRGKVFPILCTHLGKSALLNCRLVSKQWQLVVDKVLANWNSANMRYQKNMEPFCDKYWFLRKPLLPNATQAFKIPLTTNNLLKLNQYKIYPQGNAFLARAVGFMIGNPTVGTDWFSDMNEIFRNYGQYIHHLRIFGRNEGIRMNSTQYNKMCHIIFRHLKFLKSLSFYSLDIRIVSGTDIRGHFTKLKSDSLEKLSIIGQHERSPILQRLLIDRFAKQIKILYCTVLSSRYFGSIFFDCLLELKIIKPLMPKELKDLLDVQAPNLENLKLTLAGGVGHYKLLVLLARLFPSLIQLKLKFPEDYSNFLSREIENCPTGLLVCTKLRWVIVKSYKNIISYDFLCLFPFVKKLTIRHEITETGETENLNNTDVKLETHDETSQRAVNQNITGLAEYIQLDDINEQSKMLIYKSNIWEVMLNLQDLEIKSKNRNGVLTKSLFTREKYISLNCK